jgi:hypothetical protein
MARNCVSKYNNIAKKRVFMKYIVKYACLVLLAAIVFGNFRYDPAYALTPTISSSTDFIAGIELEIRDKGEGEHNPPVDICNGNEDPACPNITSCPSSGSCGTHTTRKSSTPAQGPDKDKDCWCCSTVTGKDGYLTYCADNRPAGSADPDGSVKGKDTPNNLPPPKK